MEARRDAPASPPASGRVDDLFLYNLRWEDSITRRRFEAADFDRSVVLAEGAGRELVRLAPLIRPLVQRLWSSRVVAYNRLPEGALDEFLFRRARLDAVRLRLSLLELQEGRCLYTGVHLRAGDADVDHFLPWSRSPVNAIENLVVADRRINNNKRDHLASVEFVELWCQRNNDLRNELSSVAVGNRWETAPGPTLGIARALYATLHPRTPLWAGQNHFVVAESARLRAALFA